MVFWSWFLLSTLLTFILSSFFLHVFVAFHVIAVFRFLVIFVKGIRIDHPKIGHLGIRIILSGKQLRNSRFRKSSLSSFLPKCRVYIFLCKIFPTPHSSLVLEETIITTNHHYHWRQKSAPSRACTSKAYWNVLHFPLISPDTSPSTITTPWSPHSFSFVLSLLHNLLPSVRMVP